MNQACLLGADEEVAICHWDLCLLRAAYALAASLPTLTE